MSKNPFSTPEFQTLFREWNERLKQDGFEDAEDFTLPVPALRAWHSFRWKDPQAEIQSYYEKATELLFNGFTFKNDLQRRVWELHSQGLSVRDIAEKLNSQLLGYRGRERNNVHYIILKIQKASGLKNG